MLDGVYRRTEGEPVFDEARAPTGDELKGLLDQIVARLMKLLTLRGYLVEEQGMTYLADTDADHPLASLQAASCTYRIAFGPRAGQTVLSLRTVAGQDEKPSKVLCADAHGFSLHAAVRCGADQRKQLERLCRYITRPQVANQRLLLERATTAQGRLPSYSDSESSHCPPSARQRQGTGTSPPESAGMTKVRSGRSTDIEPSRRDSNEFASADADIGVFLAATSEILPIADVDCAGRRGSIPGGDADHARESGPLGTRTKA